MVERPPAIVVVGSYNRDVVLTVPRFPAAGETLIGATRMEVPGGKGSNQAIQAARCGLPTAIIAAIGQDAAGDEAMALWRAEGIDTTGVVRVDNVGTGMAAILVDAAGENMIVVDSGANGALTPAHVEAAADLLQAAEVVVAQLEVPYATTRRALEIARAGNPVTLLNAAPAPDALDPELLKLAHILVVNAGEGGALTGLTEPEAIASALLDRAGFGVIVTLGASGAIYHRRGGDTYRLPAIPVEVVDTTGAGDAFVGALAHGIARGDPFPSPIEFGIAAGSLACTRRGAANSLPRWAEIEDRLLNR